MFFWIPVHRELDEAFQSDRSLPINLIACSLALMLLAAELFATQENLRAKTTWPIFLVCMAGAGCLGAILAVGLTLKDVVKSRIARGDSVNRILKLYFASRGLSLTAWVVTATVVSIIAAAAFPH